MLLFSLDDRRYALPAERVVRVVRVVAIAPLPHAPVIVLGAIDLAGTVVPAIDLRRRLAHPPQALRLSDQLIIASTRTRTVALLVDAADDVVDAPSAARTSAAEIAPGLELFAGALKLPDGLVLIHDLDRLLDLEEEAALDRALRDAPSAGRPTRSGRPDVHGR